MESPKANSIEEYISNFPVEVQELLKQMKVIIEKAAPAAQKAIKYGIPTYVYKGNLVSFSAFKKHIGFYPAPRNDASFGELEKYPGGKGTVQFPLDKPLPGRLITKMVKFRIKKNEEKFLLKNKNKNK